MRFSDEMPECMKPIESTLAIPVFFGDPEAGPSKPKSDTSEVDQLPAVIAPAGLSQLGVSLNACAQVLMLDMFVIIFCSIISFSLTNAVVLFYI